MVKIWLFLTKYYRCEAPEGGGFLTDYAPGEPLSKELSKKYAVCKRKMELGIWSHNLLNVKEVTLSTWSKAVVCKGVHKGESKNTRKWLKYDLRMFRIQFNKVVRNESCFIIEISPESHIVEGRMTVCSLLHLHGFVWTEKLFEYAELHKIISEIWGEVHDSPVVYIKDIWSDEGAKKYNIKHVVKDYLDGSVSGHRMLYSRGWLPVGWKRFMKIAVSWLLEVRYPAWVKDNPVLIAEYCENNPVQAENCVYMAKEIMDDTIRRWCKGESVKFEFRDKIVYIKGLQIYERMGSING